MHKLSITLVCLVLASPACWAVTRHGQRFDLARPGTTMVQFQQDRDDCILRANLEYHGRSSLLGHKNYCQNNPNGLPPVPGYENRGPNYYNPPAPTPYDGYHGGAGGPNYYRADGLFLKCMRAKGYTRVPESTGFSVGPIWR